MTATLEPDTKEGTDLLTEEEIREFVRKINKGKEPECEALHNADAGHPKCTVRVTARARYACTGGSKNVCQATEDFIRACQADREEVICDKCWRPCSECWTVVKI